MGDFTLKPTSSTYLSLPGKQTWPILFDPSGYFDGIIESFNISPSVQGIDRRDYGSVSSMVCDYPCLRGWEFAPRRKMKLNQLFWPNQMQRHGEILIAVSTTNETSWLFQQDNKILELFIGGVPIKMYCIEQWEIQAQFVLPEAEAFGQDLNTIKLLRLVDPRWKLNQMRCSQFDGNDSMIDRQSIAAAIINALPDKQDDSGIYLDGGYSQGTTDSPLTIDPHALDPLAPAGLVLDWLTIANNKWPSVTTTTQGHVRNHLADYNIGDLYRDIQFSDEERGDASREIGNWIGGNFQHRITVHARVYYWLQGVLQANMTENEEAATAVAEDLLHKPVINSALWADFTDGSDTYSPGTAFDLTTADNWANLLTAFGILDKAYLMGQAAAAVYYQQNLKSLIGSSAESLRSRAYCEAVYYDLVSDDNKVLQDPVPYVPGFLPLDCPLSMYDANAILDTGMPAEAEATITSKHSSTLFATVNDSGPTDNPSSIFRFKNPSFWPTPVATEKWHFYRHPKASTTWWQQDWTPSSKSC